MINQMEAVPVMQLMDTLEQFVMIALMMAGIEMEMNAKPATAIP